jgi:hypothetical protein
VCVCNGELKMCSRIAIAVKRLRESVSEVPINPIIRSRIRYFRHAYSHQYEVHMNFEEDCHDLFQEVMIEFACRH